MEVLEVKKLIGDGLMCLTRVLHMQTCVRHTNEITLSDYVFKIEKHTIIQKTRKVGFSVSEGHMLGKNQKSVIFSTCLTRVGHMLDM